MEVITFQNQNFRVREIQISEFGNVLISTNSLNELLLNEGGSYSSKEAQEIDEQIFYFVEDDEIDFDEEGLIKTIALELR